MGDEDASVRVLPGPLVTHLRLGGGDEGVEFVLFRRPDVEHCPDVAEGFKPG